MYPRRTRLFNKLKEHIRTNLNTFKIPLVQAECAEIVVKLDGYNKQEMADIMKKFNVVSPITGNELSGNM